MITSLEAVNRPFAQIMVGGPKGGKRTRRGASGDPALQQRACSSAGSSRQSTHFLAGFVFFEWTELVHSPVTRSWRVRTAESLRVVSESW